MYKSVVLKYLRKRSFLELAKASQAPCFKSYGQIQKVALFVDPKHLEEAAAVKDHLKRDGKLVRVYLILPAKNKNKDAESENKLFSECVVFDASRFNWLQVPDPDLAVRVADQAYDVVISFAADDLRLQYMILNVPCNFRIGTESLDYPFFDLTVTKQPNQSMEDIFIDIKKYLSLIRTI